ncbi:MAG TPA: molybdate ABC transporter substrate-binding protein [Pirellulales bacterium]|jgi:molybdate transport system substrate-binding protein|nr:molybdate ABC transporter substrate-binding protein [Pirellulales bacterium]
MSSTERTLSGANWQPDWGVDLHLAVTRTGRTVVDQDQAEVLEAIGRYHSISAAARGIGISYRHAWKLVQQANEAAGVTLVEAATGGLRGGGATLTDRGRLALETYHQLRSELTATSGAVLKRIVSSAGGTANLHVAAAISLQEMAGQLFAEYAQVRPVVHVRAVFGASNELADHLMAGAPCDLFICADAADLDRLETAGFIEAGSTRKLATNGLAAIAPIGRTIGVRRPRDLLSSAVKQVALAEPACPLGKLSKEFLEASGLYEPLRPKALFVDNSRAILAAIHSGVAEVGLAFTSDAAKTRECQTLFQLRPGQASIDYAAAVPCHSSNTAEASRLLDFFASPAARRCFRRCGFRPL